MFGFVVCAEGMAACMEGSQHSPHVLELTDTITGEYQHHISCNKVCDTWQLSTGWSCFVQDINLEQDDVLALMQTGCPWKLRYSVYSWPESVQVGDDVAALSLMLCLFLPQC